MLTVEKVKKVIESHNNPSLVVRLGEVLPENVLNLEALIGEHPSFFHIYSRNPNVESCAEAALNRHRLTKRGIPLRDELKSLLYEVTTDDGPHYVAVHCNGTDRIDETKVCAGLGIDESKLRKVDDPSLYGLVNPFLLFLKGYHGRQVQQIFDESVVGQRHPPETMMTNAGDRTWAIEFYPQELVEILGAQARVLDVSQKDSKEILNPKLGIYTGNPPDSGLLFTQFVLDHIKFLFGNSIYGDSSYPPFDLKSSPHLGETMELRLREEAIWRVISADLESMIQNGANILCVPCNTTPYYDSRIQELVKRYQGVEYISMAETVAEYVASHGIQKVRLLGIGLTQKKENGSYPRLHQVTKVQTLDERAVRNIEGIANDVKNREPLQTTKQKLNQLIREGGDSILHIAALTEFSQLLQVPKPYLPRGHKCIDALEIYAQAVAERYFQSAYP